MRRPLRSLRSGFTLIELLAVMLIIGILARFLVPNIMAAFQQGNVTACRANMKSIAEGLTIYKSNNQMEWPEHSGALFFCCLISEGTWENTAQNREKLSCPEVSKNNLDLRNLDEEEWYRDSEDINGARTAYAGWDWDSEGKPNLGKSGSGKLIIVSDDNDDSGGMNHAGTTVYLAGDLTVRAFEMTKLRKDGDIDEEDEVLYVGPESQLDILKRLSLD
ncbi:MAG: type II secretion system protein [Planctomycetota bacterium]|nr:type II secretion system protein [Planctomycetota bacterium]